MAPVLRHADDSPEAVSTAVPSSGALPVLARQIISPSRASAMAAPVARVACRACSTVSFRRRSRARSSERAPPPALASALATVAISCAASAPDVEAAGSKRGSSPKDFFPGSGRQLGRRLILLPISSPRDAIMRPDSRGFKLFLQSGCMGTEVPRWKRGAEIEVFCCTSIWVVS